MGHLHHAVLARFLRRALAVLALSLGGVTVAGAQVSETLSYRLYPVEVGARESLSRALSRATPIRPGWWQRFHGLTSWKVTWRYRQDLLPDGRCQSADTEVELVTEITLPEWVQGPEMERQAFDTYLEALKTHELGHHGIARDAAQKVKDGIRQAGAQADCGALDDHIRRLTAALIQEAKAVEVQYDKDTRFGRTQGATLEQ